MIELVDVRLDHPRGGTPLLTDASLEVGRGDVVMIVGAAGVGTSRLVAAALGEVPVSGGRIEVLGRDVAKLRRASLRLMRRRVGVVPQELCLLEDRSAQLNVALPLEIDGIPRSMTDVRAGEMLELLGLCNEGSLPVEHMCAADRQRVAVARALVRKPDIVIADHPTSMQDETGAETVCVALASAAARGAAVIVLGRDPVLRTLAARMQWRQLALVEGRLLPLTHVPAAAVEAALEAASSQPAPLPLHPEVTDEGEIPNVVPFPITARTAGVA